MSDNTFDFSSAIGSVIGFVKNNPWIAVTALCIWFAMRTIQSDIKFFPTVPARFRIFCLPAFTLAAMPLSFYGVAEAGGHVTWFAAVVGSLIAAWGSSYFHETIVEALRKGKAIPIPFLTIPGASPAPAAPPTKPLEAGDPPPPPPV